MRPSFQKWLFFFFSLGFAGQRAWAYTPMEYYNSLVAGVDIGFQDGDFNKAKFSHPSGIVFDGDGKRLFVADRDNNRIRVIYMDEDNRVETLTGTGENLDKDGPLAQAGFSQPWDIIYVPKNRLIVYDNGSRTIREIDLDTQSVATLGYVGITGAWNLTYRPQDDSVYFSSPAGGAVSRLDLKTKKVSILFQNNPLVPQPRALKVLNNKFYVADGTHFCEILIDDKTSAASVTLITTLKSIQSIAYTDDKVYALGDPEGLYEVVPDNHPVTLLTAWGFFAPFGLPQAEPLISCADDKIYSLAVSPREPRKFYVSGSGSGIYSFKDYSFSTTIGAEGSRDFDYPAVKPPKTFRILVAGDSRILLGSTTHDTVTSRDTRTNIFPKQLEFLLNLEGSRNNVDTHYEVFMLGHLGESSILFGCNEIPDLVKKYDIDLVYLLGSLNYQNYFNRPVSPEGIPGKTLDPEYSMKPIKDRIPPGPAGQFYKDCEKKGLFKSLDLSYFENLADVRDPELRADLMGMFGIPLKYLTDKLGAIPLGNGSRAKVVLGYVPWDNNPYTDSQYDGFWSELAQKNNVSFVSVSEGYETLREAFYPTNEAVFAHHYTAYGHLLVAYLLTHALLDQKLVPFVPIQNKK